MTRSGPGGPTLASGDGEPLCANCSAPLGGRFCAACGQEARGLDRPLREIVGEWAGTFFAFDTRVMRTVARLARRPGALTVDVWEGRRERYVPALRFYLGASVLLFLVVAWLDLPLVQMDVGEVGGRREAVAVVTASPSAEDLETLADLGLLGRSLATALADPEAFQQRLFDRLPAVVFLLVPLLAGFLQLLLRRTRRFWLEHFVFALHLQTFGFLALTVGVLVDRLLATDLFAGLAVLATVAYLFLALRTAYGVGRLRALLVTAALAFAYLLATAVAMLGLIVLSGLI